MKCTGVRRGGLGGDRCPRVGGQRHTWSCLFLQESLYLRLSLRVARLARSSSGDIIFEETPCCRALVARNHWLRDLRTLSCEHDLTDEPSRAQIETAGKRSVGSWRGAATVWKQSAKLETARRRKTKHQNRRSKRLYLAGSPRHAWTAIDADYTIRCGACPAHASTSAHGHEKRDLYLILYTITALVNSISSAILDRLFLIEWIPSNRYTCFSPSPYIWGLNVKEQFFAALYRLKTGVPVKIATKYFGHLTSAFLNMFTTVGWTTWHMSCRRWPLQ